MAVRHDGARFWRQAGDFPPDSRETSWYLHSGGRLKRRKPGTMDGYTSLISDPRNPMSIPGRAFPGARDAREFELQSEVRTFTSDPLKEPVEWTGRIHADLHVASTAPDTDVIVRISDVYPDGRSILVVDYPWRLRYRGGFEKEQLMAPGEIVNVRFPVGWISLIFNRGHRIRVTIASTGAPLYEPNPQTGEPLTVDFPDDARIATNSIHHAGRHASRILAPVVESLP